MFWPPQPIDEYLNPLTVLMEKEIRESQQKNQAIVPYPWSGCEPMVIRLAYKWI